MSTGKNSSNFGNEEVNAPEAGVEITGRNVEVPEHFA